MLRKSFICGLLLVIGLSSIQIAGAQQRPDWVGRGLPQTLVVCTTTGDTANLRSGTDTSEMSWARLQNGARIEVLEEERFPDRWSWFYVRHVVPGRPDLRLEGWMHGSLITRNCNVPHDPVIAGSRGTVVDGVDLGAPAPDRGPMERVEVEVCVHSGDTLNLRVGPGTDRPIIAALENGTLLRVLTGDAAQLGSWLRVELADESQVHDLGRQLEGYVFARHTRREQCQVLHNPAVAGTRGSRVGALDITLGAWAHDHDLHILNPDHPQSRRVMASAGPANQAYLAHLGISEDPYPEDTAAISRQADAPATGQGASGSGTRTVTGSPAATPTAAAIAAGAGTASTRQSNDIAKFRDVERVGKAPYGIYSIALSPDNSLLVLGLVDSTTRLFDVASLSEVGAFNLEGQETDHGAAVTAAAFSPNGQIFASGEPWKRYDYANPYSHLRIRDRGGRLLHSLHVNEPMRGAKEIAFSPDSKLIAVATPAGTAMLWDVSTGQLIWETVVSQGADPGRYATSVAFAPDGTSLFVGIHAGAVVELNATNGHELRRYPTRTGAYSQVFLSPDGRTIGVSNVNGDTLVIDRSSGVTRQTIRSGSTTSAFFSPDGSHVVAIGADNGRPIGYFSLAGHNDRYYMREDFHRPSSLGSMPGRTIGAMASDGSFMVLGDRNGDILIVRPRP